MSGQITHHYTHVIAPGPFIILRLPCILRKGHCVTKYPARWRDIVRAVGTIMRSHGLRQKDISAIEGLACGAQGCGEPNCNYQECWDPYSKGKLRVEQDALFARLEAAYAGDTTKFSTHWLWDWQDDRFILVREPSKRVKL